MIARKKSRTGWELWDEMNNRSDGWNTALHIGDPYDVYRGIVSDRFMKGTLTICTAFYGNSVPLGNIPYLRSTTNFGMMFKFPGLRYSSELQIHRSEEFIEFVTSDMSRRARSSRYSLWYSTYNMVDVTV